ncbi:MAG: hypothetical protein ACQEW9_06710 [Bacteroidota bacterium]
MLSSRNRFLLLFGLFFFTTLLASHAQREIYADSIPFKDRLYYGGNFGMQFGTITLVDVSPLVGVMITERYSAGVGITYQYFNDRRFVGGSSSTYGGRIFNRFNVLPNIFIHGELETINFDYFNRAENRFQRIWSNALFLGGGYFAPFGGGRGGANFTFLYNILHDNLRSPYGEPYVIRVGFVF